MIRPTSLPGSMGGRSHLKARPGRRAQPEVLPLRVAVMTARVTFRSFSARMR